MPARGTPELAEPAAPPPSSIDDRTRVYRDTARREVQRLGIPYELIDAVMAVESRYDPLARGRSGEVGLMQVMPQTARLLGFTGDERGMAEPETNIRLGASYLAEARRLAHGDLCTTVMKYRAGHAETRFSVLSVRYCVRVRQHLAAIGYAVTGDVPAPSFGFAKDVSRMGIAIGSIAAVRRLSTGRRLISRVSWRAYDGRLKTLDAKARLLTSTR